MTGCVQLVTNPGVGPFRRRTRHHGSRLSARRRNRGNTLLNLKAHVLAGPFAPSVPRQEESYVVPVIVKDNRAESRYEILDDEKLAGLEQYEISGDRISFLHTEVDSALAGRGSPRRSSPGPWTTCVEGGSSCCPFAATFASSSQIIQSSTWISSPRINVPVSGSKGGSG